MQKGKKLKILSFIVLSALLIVSMVATVRAASIYNVVGLSNWTLLSNTSSTYLYAETFMTDSSGGSLTAIILPLTLSHNNPLGTLIVSIYPVSSTDGSPQISSNPLVNVQYNISQLTPSYALPQNIQWTTIAVNPYTLSASTTYALVVYDLTANPTGGVYLWKNSNVTNTFNGQVWYSDDSGATWTNYGGETNFGMQLTIGGAAETTEGAEFTYTILSVFISLGLGSIGFGMSKGKEPMTALFMFYLGLMICYYMTWLPSWILVSSFAVLGIILADKFRGLIRK